MKISKNTLFVSKEWIDQSNQLLIVTASGWDTHTAAMQLYERHTGHQWKKAGESFPVVLGRNGLAWGLGLHSFTEITEQQKKEGDGKSPAGVFQLENAFGFTPEAETDWIHLPYVHITEKWECVDDANSPYYNQIIKNDAVVSADWNSSEKMRAVGDEYEWGIVVKHNMEPVTAGCGSCIFLHIWKDQQTGTAGCTAMEKSNMETLLRWLDPKKNPILIQLPQSETGLIISILDHKKNQQ